MDTSPSLSPTPPPTPTIPLFITQTQWSPDGLFRDDFFRFTFCFFFLVLFFPVFYRLNDSWKLSFFPPYQSGRLVVEKAADQKVLMIWPHLVSLSLSRIIKLNRLCHPHLFLMTVLLLRKKFWPSRHVQLSYSRCFATRYLLFACGTLASICPSRQENRRLKPPYTALICWLKFSLTPLDKPPFSALFVN